MVGKPLAEVKIVFIERLPIPDIAFTEQQPFIALADQLLTDVRHRQAADTQFATLLRAELGPTAPLTGKLALNQEWKVWSTALQKVLGRTLTLAEKGEWLRWSGKSGQNRALSFQCHESQSPTQQTPAL